MVKSIFSFKIITLLILAGVCVFGSASSSLAQEQIYRFKHIATSDKFLLNSVNSIEQDEKGMIWLGTRNGLMRYDGVELKVMRREEGDFETRRINDIYSIYVDSSQGIWMGTQGGLSLFEDDMGTSKNFKWMQSTGLTTNSRLVYEVQGISPREVWIGSHGGLNIYDKVIEKMFSYSSDPENEQTLSHNRVTCIYKSSDGNIWVGTNLGLNKLINRDGFDLKFRRYYVSGLRVSDQTNRVSCIQEDLDGNLLVGTQKGLFRLNTELESFEKFEASEYLENAVITAMTIDHSDRLWVGTYNGLKIYDREDNLLHTIRYNPQVANGLTGNHIRELFTDRTGGIWISTYYGGINYWDEGQMAFRMINERGGTQLGYNVVSAIIEDNNSTIYFGTEGAGVNVFDPRSNKFTKIEDLGYNDPIGTVKDLLFEAPNTLWICTFNKGLINLNLDNLEHHVYSQNYEDPNSISSNQTLTISKAEDGKFWVGTVNGGLNLFDPETKKFTVFNSDSPFSVLSNNVRAALITKSGDLVVGTANGLLTLKKDRYRKSDFNFVPFKMKDGSENNLYIHDLLEDKNEKIWIATQGDGLCYLEADRIISVGLDGFTTVFAVIEDSDGKLWLSTEEGIVSYQSTSREYETFNKKDGVAANEFNRGAGLVASDGNIFFGGASGVTTFSPATLIRTNDYAPDVIITKFTLLGEEVNVKDSTQILDKSIEYTDEISLNYDQNIFSVHFAMPNYINSEKNTYSYRLKGLDDSWTKSVNPFVAFTIQKGGYYEFQVKGINSDGIESENVTQLIIKVRNAPWKTWWAYSIYIILVTVGALIFIFFFQSRLRLKHKLELEEQAFVQQEEINQQKLQFFTNISHEFRTPLTLISGPLEKLILEYKGPSSVFKQLQVIKRNTDQLFKLINELMDFRKLENKQMKLEAAEGNIVRFVNEIFLSFSQQAKIKKAKYTFHSDKNEILIFFDRDKLEKVLFNLLSNAFKYTSSKGKIEVIVEDKSESVWVHVIDNGDGISPDYLDRVFDRFYEIPLLKKRSKAKVGTGIGLAIAKNMMELHKGEVTVSSKVGEGSTFTVKLKKGRKHLEDEDLLQSFKNSEDITHYKSQSIQETMLETEELFLDKEPAESKEKTILIVEDNPEISGFMKSILDKFYNIICAENGAVGFQRSLSEQPDLILSDLMMPVMDGTEFCSKIKSDVRTSHIPFVLLTARTSLVYKYDGLESGADEYLTKPFKIKEVLLKCKNIINTQDHLKKKFASSGEIPSSNITVNSIDETMMNQAIAIIRENISNEFLNIPMLCAELGVSRSLLFTKFKSWTNQTPNEFILKARMRHAASLIEQNKTNISQIAYKVGLKSPNYFSKLFKKHYSLSPKEYAKKFKSSLGME